MIRSADKICEKVSTNKRQIQCNNAEGVCQRAGIPQCTVYVFFCVRLYKIATIF